MLFYISYCTLYSSRFTLPFPFLLPDVSSGFFTFPGYHTVLLFPVSQSRSHYFLNMTHTVKIVNTVIIYFVSLLVLIPQVMPFSIKIQYDVLLGFSITSTNNIVHFTISRRVAITNHSLESHMVFKCALPFEDTLVAAVSIDLLDPVCFFHTGHLSTLAVQLAFTPRASLAHKLVCQNFTSVNTHGKTWHIRTVQPWWLYAPR